MSGDLLDKMMPNSRQGVYAPYIGWIGVVALLCAATTFDTICLTSVRTFMLCSSAIFPAHVYNTCIKNCIYGWMFIVLIAQMMFLTEAVVLACNEISLRSPANDSIEATSTKQEPLFFFNSPVCTLIDQIFSSFLQCFFQSRPAHKTAYA